MLTHAKTRQPECSRYNYVIRLRLIRGSSKYRMNVEEKMSETTTTAKTDSQRPITYFDISIAGLPAGRVIFQLYNDLVPKTAENFRQ